MRDKINRDDLHCRLTEAYNYLRKSGIIHTKADFANAIGKKQPAVSDALNNKGRVLTEGFLLKVANAFPGIISKEYLMEGIGEIGLPAKPAISYTDGIPYYNIDFKLGFDEIAQPNSENPDFLVRMPGYEKATLWCNASGHSMEPEINSGDIIALQRIEDFSFLPFGDVYGIITTNGMRTIKRLGRSQHDGYYRLIPTNKEYDEQEIPINKIAMVYRVMGAMKAF